LNQNGPSIYQNEVIIINLLISNNTVNRYKHWSDKVVTSGIFIYFYLICVDTLDQIIYS